MGERARTDVEPSEAGQLAPAARGSPDAFQLAERGLRVAIGLVALAVGSVAEAIASTFGRWEPAARSADDDEPTPMPLLPMLAGAGLAVGLEVARTSVRAASGVGRSLGPWTSFLTWPRPVRQAMERARDRAERLDEQWRAERAEDERFGSAFIDSLLPPIADAVLDRLDLTKLAISRVDIDRVVDRVNLDAIAARLDVEAIVRRLDLVEIAREVIDQIDLPRIVRESTGTMANETVEGFRAQGMSADRAVSRFVDRILGRDGYRDDPE